MDVLFLDFAKAFDKVPHQRLLVKMRSLGIGGVVLRWIEQWLKDRRQRVGFRGKWSGWGEVLSGVPQGSVLGPVLFLIFIDDIDEGLRSSILKFADDTKIYGVVNSWEDRERLQKDLNRLVEWASRWQMKFNEEKCNVMHLGRENMGWNYVMNGKRLKVVEEEKDLGVLLTRDMKVSVQCGGAYAKANKMLGLIRRVIVNKRKDIMLRLYKSLVRPRLEYCTAVWSPHYSKDRELIERIQHRFTKMIPEVRELGYEERLKRLGLMSLEERRNRSDMVEMYKISTGISALPFERFFQYDGYGRTRGHTRKIVKNRFNTDVRKYFFSNRVVARWNGLGERVVNSRSLLEFKKNINEYGKMGLLHDL